MRIAQLAPLFERVPPEAYGGIERVVSALTEALVRRGHAVGTARGMLPGHPVPHGTAVRAARSGGSPAELAAVRGTG